jgi:predicted ATPase
MIIDSLRLFKPVPEDEWPFYLPPVRQIVESSLSFTKPVTFIVGENGSGKSTIIEAIAEAYGLDVRGGHGGRKYAVAAPQSPLGKVLKLDLTSTGQRVKHKRAQGFFLRSETAMGVFEYMSDMGVPGYGGKHLSEVSHGEGYLQVLLGRFEGQGLYLLDEPEAALSFTTCLALMEQLSNVVKNGSQVICATHSPIITALPRADILEFGKRGIQNKQWSELDLVKQWQRYMASPEYYIKDLEI